MELKRTMAHYLAMGHSLSLILHVAVNMVLTLYVAAVCFLNTGLKYL